MPGASLDKHNAKDELDKSADWFHEKRPLTIDLGGVERADSAGVALLLAWQRRAEAADVTVGFVNVPNTIRAIIEVSGLAPLLALKDNEARGEPGSASVSLSAAR